MALQALLFSKNPETVRSLTAIMAEAGIRVEACADIFSAMEKAKTHSFQCVIADWVDQPEAGYLVKRARESTVNRGTVAMAVVDDEFAAKRAREDQIEFIFHRPIVPDEARSVLGSARHRMKASEGSLNNNLQAAQAESDATSEQAGFEDPNLVATAADLPESSQHIYEPEAEVGEQTADSAEQEVTGIDPPRNFRRLLQRISVAAILLFAIFLVWRERAAFVYLARTPEGGMTVLRHSFAALFYANVSGAQSVGSAGTEAQQDAYFSRNSSTPVVQSGGVRVVTGEVVIREVSRPLPKAFDFPLPEPELAHAPEPARRVYAKVPDSIRNSAPIPPPTTLPVIPAQLLPISTPPPSIPQVSEPVQLTEEAARALAIHVVDAAYPNEARSQKLRGAVVLQALIERDGTVQDVKIVRGYFLLGRAAASALKQWRFRPYMFNGKPIAVRTQITMNFSYPPA